MQGTHGVLVDLSGLLRAPPKDVRRPVQQRLLPLVDHRRMHAIFRSQFRHGALALHGLQRHASLEDRVVIPAFAHVLISSLLEINRRQFVASVTVRFSGRCSQIDIPPSFSTVLGAGNSDGGISSSTDGHAELRVWGGYLSEGDFEGEVQWRIDQDVTDRWTITYRKWKQSWASWSGVRVDRVLYQRAIEACDGAAAYFRLECDEREVKAFDRVIARLVKSLQSAPC